MGYQCAIRVFNINREGDGSNRACHSSAVLIVHDIDTTTFSESKEPAHMFNPIGSKATVCSFSVTPGIVVTGHESGKVALFNYKTGEEVENNERAHSDTVTDLQMSKDRTYFITSSKDKIARVCGRHCG